MRGTTRIDFAGTLEEAQAFASEHRAKFPRTFGIWVQRRFASNGCAILNASWRNYGERHQVRSMLERLGWDEGSQLDTVYRA